MYVACPSCKSLYQIELIHLRAAGGRLHCGQCQTVFRATEAVFEDPQQALAYEYPVQEDVAREIDDLVNRALDEVPGQEQLDAQPGAENVVESAEVTESEPPHAGLEQVAIEPVAEEVFEPPVIPEIDEVADLEQVAMEAVEEVTADIPEVVEIYEEPAISGRFPADFDNYAQPVAAEFVRKEQADAGEADLSAVLLEDEYYERSGRTGWGTIAAAFLLTFMLMGQYAYVERFRLVHFSQLRPALETYCQLLNCDLPLRRDVSQVEMVEREVRDHPHVSDALLVNATLVNRADFVQAYPVFEVSFSDVSGTPVAVRRFQPREYLLDHGDTTLGMAPGQQAHLMLEVLDPGERAVSFQFDFL